MNVKNMHSMVCSVVKTVLRLAENVRKPAHKLNMHENKQRQFAIYNNFYSEGKLRALPRLI